MSAARDSGVELAIRSGGHSIAGHSVSDGGIVLDLSPMKALDIDPATHTAWAQTGMTAGEFTTRAAAHRLGVGFGDTGSVGIGGLTLGGGVGYLVRKYGLTIDNLLAADIVTADGRLLRVNADNHPDLFWAIRGGGGNFGVATQFQFRLHEIDMIAGGMLILPATPSTIRSFVELAQAAPEELSAIANVMPAPPMPFVPAEYHGQIVILAMLAYAGDPEAGTRDIAPFRELATPIADMVHPMHYTEIYPPEDPNYHPLGAGYSMFMDKLDDRDAELILEHLRDLMAMMRVTQIRVLGGAMARVPDDATAFAHRTRRMMVNLGTIYSDRDEA